MVDAAAHPHRVALECAKAGDGLPCVEDEGLRPGGVDEAPGQRGHTGELLNEIEGGPLGPEETGQRPLESCKDLTGRDAAPFLDGGLEPHRAVDLAKYLLGDGQA